MQNDNKELGFDWYLGQFNMGGGVVGNGGTSPSLANGNPTYNGLPTSTGYFPGQTTANQILGSASDQAIGNLTTANSGIPTVATITGILTDPNFRVVIHALEERTGTEMLAEPEVTTLSGRQTQMRATQIQTIITSFSFQGNTPSTTSTGTGTGTP
jgi:general secretion pathway protein D